MTYSELAQSKTAPAAEPKEAAPEKLSGVQTQIDDTRKAAVMPETSAPATPSYTEAAKALTGAPANLYAANPVTAEKTAAPEKLSGVQTQIDTTRKAAVMPGATEQSEKYGDMVKALQGAQQATYIGKDGEPAKAEVVPTAQQLQDQQMASENATAQDAVTKAEADKAEQEENMSYLDSMRSTYQQMYDEAVTANNEAAAANIQQVLAQIDASKKKLADQYKATNRELYRGYMEILRTTPQKLSSMGYTGGMTESSRIGVDTSYQEALAANERARLAAEGDMDLQGAQAEYQANAAAAAANAQAKQNLYSNQIALMTQEQQDLASRAQTMAGTGDFSGYLQLGYTQDEVDELTRMWIKQNPNYKDLWIKNHPEDAKRLGIKKSSSTKSGESDGGGGKTGSYNLGTLLNAAANGYSTDEIIGALKKDGVKITPAVRADVEWARGK